MTLPKMRLLASVLFLACVLHAQKSTLNTVDDALKKADQDRQAQAAAQAITAKKLVDGQNTAARMAGIAEERRREQNRQTENARDAALKQVQDTLAKIEKEKADALQAVADQQQKTADKTAKWMDRVQVGLFGVAGTVLTGLIMIGVNLLMSRRIHKLVNSADTARMQDLLSSLKTQLVTLIELRELKVSQGGSSNGAALEAIESCRAHVTQLTGQVADRLRATAA